MMFLVVQCLEKSDKLIPSLIRLFNADFEASTTCIPTATFLSLALARICVIEFYI